MRQLRPVWQLHREALMLLRERLQRLQEQPWPFLASSVLFLVATLTVPLFWKLGERGFDYVPPWVIYLTAHLAVLLRHPHKPRKAVIHPLPLWYYWLVQALCAAGAAVLSSLSTWTTRPIPPGDPRFTWTLPKLPLEYQLHAFFLDLVALSLLTTALPALLTYLEALAERLGLHRRLRFSSPNVYFLLVLLTPVSVALGARRLLTQPISVLAMGILFFLLLPAIPALLLYRKLWSRDPSALSAALPQSALWTLAASSVLITWNRGKWFLTGLEYFEPFDWQYINWTSLVVAYCALFSWLILLLRVRLVEKIDHPLAENEALSVQTDPARYVDLNNNGAQLLAFIRRSDGGVLGITGVRGAGKSALIAYLLSRLQKQHFVLSMTAPMRHDLGLDFLSAVSRAVCRRVLDGVQPALYGRKTEEGRARAAIMIQVRNLGIAAALVLLAVLTLAKLKPTFREAPASNPLQNGSQEEDRFPLFNGQAAICAYYRQVEGSYRRRPPSSGQFRCGQG